MALSRLTNNEMALQLVHCGPVLDNNLDLIGMILKYLPVKSLGRFMTVCKSWEVIIRRRDFIEMHLNWSKENPQHAVFHSLILRPTLDRPFTLHQVIASWNGLVCQRTLCSAFLPPLEKLFICNPVTQQVFELPKDENHPYSQEHRFGVSYGPQSYEYKVYKFVGPSLFVDTPQCRVYSSITGSWKNLGVSQVYPLYSFHVCLNRTVYWQISKGRKDFPGAILAIDELENFHIFDLPELESGWPYLVTFDNSLGLVVIYNEANTVSRMSIWVREGLQQPTWTKKLETSVPLFCSDVDQKLELTVSAAAWGNKVVITTPRRYLTYYIDKNIWTKELSAVVRDNDRSTFSGFFTESLLPCNGVMEP